MNPKGNSGSTRGGCDVLVVAAFPPELAGLADVLGADLSAAVSGVSVLGHAVGIGLVAAAAGAGALLERLEPAAVVLVGTVGAYAGHGLEVGEAVVARALLLLEPEVLAGRAAFPEPMPARLDVDPALLSGLAGGGARVVDVATTLGITTDDALAARLGAHAATEHLEAFAVATACRAKGVGFAAVLGVANPVGSRGRASWRAHHDTAGRAAASHVARWLRAGAPGLSTTPSS